MPATPAPGRTSVHHKFRVRLDPERAGVVSGRERSATRHDARSQRRGARGRSLARRVRSLRSPSSSGARPRRGLAWSSERETDLALIYDPARFPRTRALLDGSLVLFSQSCPLIAQSESMIDSYIEAFERVWHHRGALAVWAASQRP